MPKLTLLVENVRYVVTHPLPIPWKNLTFIYMVKTDNQHTLIAEDTGKPTQNCDGTEDESLVRLHGEIAPSGVTWDRGGACCIYKEIVHGGGVPYNIRGTTGVQEIQ